MDISNRINERIKTLGLKGVDITRYTGVSSGGVSQWRSGTVVPKGKNLFALAEMLKCTPEWLLTGGEKPTPNMYFTGIISEWDDSAPLTNNDEVVIPFFEEVEIAAGSGSAQIKEVPNKKLRFSKTTLKERNVSIKDAACAKVTGSSMEPVFPEGSTIGIDKSQTDIKDGKVYCIAHGGMLRVKLLYRIAGGGIRVSSYNKEEYPDEILKGKDLEDFRIIGRVFWYAALI